MADKTVAELPALQSVTDDTMIPVWQPGAANEAQSMTGKQFRAFAEASVTPYSDAARSDAILAEAARVDAQNAKAAAQSALSGVQTAIKNIPAGSTPIVNDLTTGGAKMALSAEQGKLLGRRPNPNLLDNWYFPNPINQRGQTQYSGTVYTIDRWRIVTSNTTVTCDSEGVSIYTATSSLAAFRQEIELMNLDNTIVTLTMLLADGTLCTDSGNTKDVSANTTSVLALADGATSGRYAALFRNETTNRFRVQLKAPTGVEMKVVAVKLELGTVQTLAHQDDTGAWVLNEIPDKSEELLKCCMSTADSSDTYANNKKTASTVGAVALDGSNTMTGNLVIEKNTPIARWRDTANGSESLLYAANHRAYLQAQNVIGDDKNRRYLQLLDSTANSNISGALHLVNVINGVTQPTYPILHTGNKPIGSYTGNGDATARTIATGGANMSIGVLIFSNNGGALVTKTSSVLWSSVRGVLGVTYDEVHFTGSALVIASDNLNLNENGTTYYYQVL